MSEREGDEGREREEWEGERVKERGWNIRALKVRKSKEVKVLARWSKP